MSFAHTEFGWRDALPTDAHNYLLPLITRRIGLISQGRSLKIIDIGCGNGYVASVLAEAGHSVTGVDVSTDGIVIARAAYPHIQFFVCSVYDEQLMEIAGALSDCLIALELVEHLLYPKQLFEQSYRLLRPGGHLIISTPSHGYVKNLSISLLGGWDGHFGVDQDGGHIKFFSRKTIGTMAANSGFRNLRFDGAGRIPGLRKSMIMIGKK